MLVSDIGMPGEDGYALIRRVRALGPDRGGQVPAAALTAYAKGEDGQRVLSAGFQVHLPKPVQPADLANVVATLARPRPRRTLTHTSRGCATPPAPLARRRARRRRALRIPLTGAERSSA